MLRRESLRIIAAVSVAAVRVESLVNSLIGPALTCGLGTKIAAANRVAATICKALYLILYILFCIIKLQTYKNYA